MEAWSAVSSEGTSALVVASNVVACCTSRSLVRPLVKRSWVMASALFLRRDVFAGNRQSALITAHVNVIARHVAEQRDQGGAPAEFRGGDLVPGRFRRAAFAAEHVNFPRGVEAGLINIIFKRHTRRNRQRTEHRLVMAGSGSRVGTGSVNRSAKGSRRRCHIARALPAPAPARFCKSRLDCTARSISESSSGSWKFFHHAVSGTGAFVSPPASGSLHCVGALTAGR